MDTNFVRWRGPMLMLASGLALLGGWGWLERQRRNAAMANAPTN
jgi:hypothetical protein